MPVRHQRFSVASSPFLLLTSRPEAGTIKPQHGSRCVIPLALMRYAIVSRPAAMPALARAVCCVSRPNQSIPDEAERAERQGKSAVLPLCCAARSVGSLPA